MDTAIDVLLKLNTLNNTVWTAVTRARASDSFVSYHRYR